VRITQQIFGSNTHRRYTRKVLSVPIPFVALVPNVLSSAVRCRTASISNVAERTRYRDMHGDRRVRFAAHVNSPREAELWGSGREHQKRRGKHMNSEGIACILLGILLALDRYE
jgi:hypothetical protein